MNIAKRFIVAAAILFTSLSFAATTKTNYSTIELVAEQGSLPSGGGAITVGFFIKPDSTWHAYWLNPGDAGKEPVIRWSLPDGFSAGELAFPAPHLLPFGELQTYGFEEPVLLLADIQVPSGLTVGESIELAGAASWVVCDDKVCVPERANLSLTLVVGSGEVNGSTAARFLEARARLPELVDWNAEFAFDGEEVNFLISPSDDQQSFEAAYLYVESKQLVQYGKQASGFTRGGLAFTMGAAARSGDVESTGAILSYKQDDGSTKSVALKFTKSGGALAGVTTVVASDGGLGFLTAVFFAFVGGIVLNLMPCVFPILSMKALSLVNMAQGDRRSARESGVLYTVGILVSFAAIGAALLAIRGAGNAAGWGFQMQNPMINVGIGLLMVLIGLNLFGVFEIGTRVMGVGQGLTQGGERKSAFFTGVLAVIVATPCTAPFMASALGYALVQPASTAMCVFLALGLGLAFPYLILSFVPGLGRVMPKPGAWMESFKHLLAFPMFLTALWLFWVVGKQLGVSSMAVALLSALSLSFALWAYGRGSMRTNGKGIWYATALIGLVACAIAALRVEDSRVIPRAEGDYSAGEIGGLAIEHFDPDRVRQYIADGQPTFVYFTADWCVSCKVNERVALASDEVAKAFNERGIKVVEGDWTAEDPIITEWLEMYDRIGVPLYLYFPQGSSLETVTILPQILLPDLVINAIDAADAAAPDYVAAEITDADDAAPYVLPESEPDWSIVQAYLDVDAVWHERDSEIRKSEDSEDAKDRRYAEERGDHPEVELAHAAATAIIHLDGGHEMTQEAAEFLIQHIVGYPGQYEAMLLGANTLLEKYPDFDSWPTALKHIDRFTTPGRNEDIESFFLDVELFASDKVAGATAKYYAAVRYMRLANAVATPADARPGHRLKAIEIGTGLSAGVENEELLGRRRYTDNGEPIPFPTLAEAEEDLLYNLNFLTVGNKIPDVVAARLDGEMESVDAYEGQAVLLDFWATWCGPCVASLPKLRALTDDLPADEFEILSISVDEYVDTVVEFQLNRPMPWANWHIGPKSEILKTWAVRGYPTYILVDHEGAIVARQHDMSKEFEALIKSTACGPTSNAGC